MRAVIGRVEHVEGQYAKVSIKRQEMCGDCHGCDMLGEVKPCVINCQNSCDSKVGDLVEIDVEQNHFFRATWLMYGLPLVGLLLGLGIGSALPLDQVIKEIMMIIMALGGTAGAWLWVKQREKKKRYETYLPHLIRIIQ